MAFSVSASRSELAEINITPLVDVMLVLLVIFMVTAPVLSRPIDAMLPQPVVGKPVDPPNDLVLKVGLAGLYTLDVVRTACAPGRCACRRSEDRVAGGGGRWR